MGAITIPSAAFRYAHEEHGRLCDAATEMDLEWEAKLPEAVSSAEIDEVANQIAETGHYENEFGQPVKASDVIKALAIEWVDDPKKLPGHVYTAFYKWLTCTAALAKFGK